MLTARCVGKFYLQKEYKLTAYQARQFPAMISEETLLGERDRSMREPTGRPPVQGERDKRNKPARPLAGINRLLTTQTRKLLGKHWANKYRHGRG